jgi:hypothetical protein
MAHVSWDYTTALNIVFFLLAGVLVCRFLQTGGLRMLRVMSKPRAEVRAHAH